MNIPFVCIHYTSPFIMCIHDRTLHFTSPLLNAYIFESLPKLFLSLSSVSLQIKNAKSQEENSRGMPVIQVIPSSALRSRPTTHVDTFVLSSWVLFNAPRFISSDCSLKTQSALGKFSILNWNGNRPRQ